MYHSKKGKASIFINLKTFAPLDFLSQQCNLSIANILTIIIYMVNF